MKKLLLLFISLFIVNFSYSERYRIDYVNYDIIGITKKYALEKAVEIDKTRVFESFEDFHKYIKDIQLLFNNERNLSTTIVNVSYGEKDPEEITSITLNISTVDSKHFLALPYPKYNSNDGFILKLKAKDTNFLGTMETLNTDINFSIEPQTDNPDVYDTKFGINFDYDYPFKLWKMDSSWNNSFSIDYTIGRSSPEFSFDTGFTFSLPFKKYALEITLNQGIHKDFDYEKYGDELYFTESARLSLPYKIGRFFDSCDVTWTPYVAFSKNIDRDGISLDNRDLIGPALNIGHSLSTGRYNWHNNFRKGITFDFDQNIGFNYGKKKYTSQISATMKTFFSSTIVGFASRFKAFYYMNTDDKIGSYIRGIRDEQNYINSDTKSLTTQAAILLNLDIPIHIITTDWIGYSNALFGEDSWISNHIKWMRIFDFELQLNPFIDMALCNNQVTGKTFAIKDGWYGAGLEVLVYPAKWRSLVVRGSVGVDLGKTIINKVIPKLYDDSWRGNASSYEISIGIGLHY